MGQKVPPSSTALPKIGSSPRQRSRKFGSRAKPITRPRPTRSVHRYGEQREARRHLGPEVAGEAQALLGREADHRLARRAGRAAP